METEEPPLMLDGARVLEYAVLDQPSTAKRPLAFVVGGVSLDTNTVSRLVIAENLVEQGVFLLHCNGEWSTVAAGSYADAAAAREAAAQGYGGLALSWTAFRDLSPEERREVETTRAFLREIAAEDPHE